MYILIVNDRHADIDALPFSTLDAANETLDRFAVEYAHHAEDIEWGYELNEYMVTDRWIRYVPYSPEGDYLRIIQRDLDQEGAE